MVDYRGKKGTSSTSKVLPLAGVVLVLPLLFFTFENVADLKFFMPWLPGSALPFSLYTFLFVLPDQYLEMPCGDMSSNLILTSQVPILFKGCMDKQRSVQEDFAIFNESVSNMFPPCSNLVTREFQFEQLSGNVTDILEIAKHLNNVTVSVAMWLVLQISI